MVDLNMTLEDLTTRAYARGVPARKWVKLVHRWQAEHHENVPDTDMHAIDSLLAFLPEPPALILNYLSTGLITGLFSGRSALIAILYRQDSSSIPPQSLTTLCSILDANLTGLDSGSPLPSSLDLPTAQPNIGPSSPRAQQSRWTLSLLLPLLRYCADSTLSTRVQPIIQLVSRALAVVAPYPAPPFDVGLEASQLMVTLPDMVSAPLRESLSGLMMDLAVSDGVARTQAAAAQQQAQPRVQSGQGEGQEATSVVYAEVHQEFGPLLPQTMKVLVEHHRRTRHQSRYDIPISNPNSGMIDLLHLSWRICERADVLLTTLVNSFVAQAVSESPGLRASHVERWSILVEDLPSALQWWMSQTDAELPYPGNLVGALQHAFEANKAALDAHAEWQSATWARYSSSEEMDDEAGSFSPPDGWTWSGMREALLRRLADLGLVDEEAIGKIHPEQQIRPPWQHTGESLLQRLAGCAKSHLEAMAFVVSYAPGASRSLADEVIKTIEACPTVQPPEGLFSNLSSSPALLAALSATWPSASLLDLANRQLIEKSEDANVRADDPQGSMTRFGEGVVLIETLSAQYQLPVPDLLKESRNALHLQELSAEQKGMMNGWIKALFGSDGIDDETLLSTTPQDFCRLGCGLFQQAISATASGLIDLDTLHSGLSYFCQPLLSWSLGGIVTWLCSEIHRQGLLSALHLDVLQNLVLSSALSDGLLRSVGPAISSLLIPNCGLQPVFQSANVSVDGITAKLNAVGVVVQANPIPVAPLQTVHTAIQAARRPDFAPPDLTSTLLSSMEVAREATDDESTVMALLSELCNPSAVELSQGIEDPLVPTTSLLLVLSILPTSRPLIAVLVERNLPNLLDGHGPTFVLNTPLPLVKVIRLAMMLLHDLRPDLAKSLAESLTDELVHQRSRPSAEERESNGPLKRPSTTHKRRPLSGPARTTVDLLVKAFDSEDMIGKWPSLTRL